MKQFFKGVILLIMLVACCSCCNADCGSVNETIDYSRFFYMNIPGEKNYYIMVDRETRVEYLCYSGSYEGGRTPLLNYKGEVTFYTGVIPSANRKVISEDQTTNHSRFFYMNIPGEKIYCIMVDRETRVEYLCHSRSYLGGLSPLLDYKGEVTFYTGPLPQD